MFLIFSMKNEPIMSGRVTCNPSILCKVQHMTGHNITFMLFLSCSYEILMLCRNCGYSWRKKKKMNIILSLFLSHYLSIVCCPHPDMTRVNNKSIYQVLPPGGQRRKHYLLNELTESHKLPDKVS